MNRVYIIIPKEFAEQHKGYKVGSREFGYAVTKNGEYFCDANSVNDFPELFGGMTVTIREITREELPTPELDL